MWIKIGWLSIPISIKTASTTYNGNDGKFDVLLLGVGENDGNSNYVVAVNDKVIGTFQSLPSQFSFQEGTKYMGFFPNNAIKKGDKISVTSEVGSNDGSEFSRDKSIKELALNVQEIINSQDELGQWIVRHDKFRNEVPGKIWDGDYRIEDRISSALFNQNIDLLCAFFSLYERM